MSDFKSASCDNVNVASVTRELLDFIMKMTSTDKLNLLKKLKPESRTTISMDSKNAALTTELIDALMKAPLAQRCALLGELKAYNGSSKRKHSRQEYFVPIQYVIKGRLFSGYINNISKSGLFLEAGINNRPEVNEGDPITMNFDHPDTRHIQKVTGKIVRITKTGFGIVFDHLLY